MSTSLAPWRSPLARALHRNRSQANSRYPQLATVRPDGRPANRTVVFRDFFPDTNCLLFVTDIRSEKIDQIEHNPEAELCWYFTQTREQFRIGGTISIIDTAVTEEKRSRVRQEAWANLSDNAKQQFFWPMPGNPRTSEEGYNYIEHPDEQRPQETFAVLVFDPETVDHLELRGEPQNRYRYWRLPDQSWKNLEINP